MPWSGWREDLCRDALGAIVSLPAPRCRPNRSEEISMKRLVVHGGTLLPCVDHTVLEDSAIVVEGDRVVSIAPADELDLDAERAREDTDVLDASGQFVMPGKIDLHEHLDLRYAEANFWQLLRPRRINVVEPMSHWTIGRAFRSCLTSLVRGVTTVRDVGALDSTNIVVRDLVDAGMLLGPRIYACGAPIAMSGGHGVPHSIEADGPDGVRRAARRELKKGANLIKLMASGGSLLEDRDFPSSPQLDEDELRAAVHEAHKAGRTVAVHAHPPAAIAAAVAAGADTIEHAALCDEASAELMAREGVTLVPTLTVSAMLAEMGEAHGLPSRKVAEAEAEAEHRRQAFRYAADAGVKMGVGTDAYLDMGIEMKLMAEWGGLSPTDILIAATKHGAEALGIQHEIGTLEPGKLADLIVLPVDPRADLVATDNPTTVVRGGHLFDPVALRSAVPADLTV